MDAILKAGKWKLSLDLFDQMSELQLKADEISCNVAIMASAAAATWQYGLSVLNGRSADEISYTSCMNSCDRNFQWRLALSYLSYLGHLEKGEKGRRWRLRSNSISCNSAVSACSRGRRWNLALALFAVMSKSRIQRDTFTYSSVLSGCNLEWELALCAFKDADADEVVFNAAIDTCGHGGWTMGVKLFNDMGTKVIQRAQRRRLRSTDCKSLVTYTAVAFTCGAARWELVESLLVEMKNDKARCDLPNWFYPHIDIFTLYIEYA